MFKILQRQLEVAEKALPLCVAFEIFVYAKEVVAVK